LSTGSFFFWYAFPQGAQCRSLLKHEGQQLLRSVVGDASCEEHNVIISAISVNNLQFYECLIFTALSQIVFLSVYRCQECTHVGKLYIYSSICVHVRTERCIFKCRPILHIPQNLMLLCYIIMCDGCVGEGSNFLHLHQPNFILHCIPNG